MGRVKALVGRTKALGVSIVFWVIPVVEVWRANREIDTRINNEGPPYDAIPVWVLRIRLKQEHERAESIEAKTDRLGQRILGVLAFAGLLVTLSRPIEWTWLGIVGALGSLAYVLTAWYMTLRANQTTRVFGKGTEFEHQGIREPRVLSKEVFCQELANTKKHNSNVAAFNCLRNGLLLGVVTIFVTWLADVGGI